MAEVHKNGVEHTPTPTKQPPPTPTTTKTAHNDEAPTTPTKVTTNGESINGTTDHSDSEPSSSLSSGSEEFLNLSSTSDHTTELNGHSQRTDSVNGNVDKEEEYGTPLSAVKSEKSHNVTLAANFTPIIVSEELDVSSQEKELITNVVLSSVPDVLPLGSTHKTVDDDTHTSTASDEEDSTTTPPVVDVDTKPVESARNIIDVAMDDSFIKAVDNVPLTESYIKISLNDDVGNAADSSDGTTIVVDSTTDVSSVESEAVKDAEAVVVVEEAATTVDMITDDALPHVQVKTEIVEENVATQDIQLQETVIVDPPSEGDKVIPTTTPEEVTDTSQEENGSADDSIVEVVPVADVSSEVVAEVIDLTETPDPAPTPGESLTNPIEVLDNSLVQTDDDDDVSVEEVKTSVPPPVDPIEKETSTPVVIDDAPTATLPGDSTSAVADPVVLVKKEEEEEVVEVAKPTVVAESTTTEAADATEMPPLVAVSPTKVEATPDAVASAPVVEATPATTPAPVVEEWLDILGNGMLKKKILSRGGGEGSRPVSRNMVTIRYEGKLHDGTLVDKHDSFKFILSDEDVIQAFDLAIGLMEDKEKALVYTDARYAYGVKGRKEPKPSIPPNASLSYEIEILSIEEGPDMDKLSDTDRISYGDKKRVRGNDLFARDDYSGAINLYKRGIRYLEGSDNKDVVEMKIKCYNNLSAAQLKVKAYTSAVASLDTVLIVEPHNVKALFRKGKCLEGMKKEDEALECMKKAYALDPTNKSLRSEIDRLKSRVNVTKKKETEIYQKMFTEKAKEKVSTEEEEAEWKLKMTAVAVGLLGLVAGYLTWRSK